MAAGSTPRRYARSAYRDDALPGDRNDRVGFRCAQVQQQDAAEPAEGGWPSRGGAQAVPTTSGEAAALKIDSGKPQSIQIPAAPAIIVRSDIDTLRLEKIEKPSWAVGIGRDRYGLWADFEVATNPENEVLQQLYQQADSEMPKAIRQRMRWIPPGRFMMGSTDDDDQAYDWEKPAHEVTISFGYWLFDTPVTQQLWTAVMSENPSYFFGEKDGEEFAGMGRPVEQVSWDDTQRFLVEINRRNAGLQLVLPTEAEWEYACRAGTKTRFAFGDELTNEQANFRVEDDNSEKRKQTTTVASYSANRWGLYDMHGNVFEWCQDWYGKYLAEPAIDPVGPGDGQVPGDTGWQLDQPRAARAVRLPPTTPTRLPGTATSASGVPKFNLRQAASGMSAGLASRRRSSRDQSECSERAMKLHFFAIDARIPDEEDVQELNRILATERIVSVDKQLVVQESGSYWSICVTSAAVKSKDSKPGSRPKRIDYRDVLNEQDFSIFARLRTLRKELAERDGVPAYALFTNEQLADLVRKRVTSKQAMEAIQGVGAGRIEKYGDTFLNLLKEVFSAVADQEDQDAEEKQDPA